MRPRYIIFDLDGTLVDSVAICVEILNEMLAERGSKRLIVCETAIPFVSMGGAKMMAALLGEYCNHPDDEIEEFRLRYASRSTPEHSLFPGVREGLLDLRRAGRVLAICSNKPQNLCEKVLVDLQLDRLFDVIIGTAPGRQRKPAPDLLDLTLGHWDAAPSECLLVGDSELDYEIARACDVPFRLVNYGYAAPDYDFGETVRHDQFCDVSRAIIDGAIYPIVQSPPRFAGSSR